MLNKIKIKNQDIMDILGIEKKNVKNYNKRKLKRDFKILLQNYDIDQIWLKEDYGIYVNGNILKETTYLYAVTN